MSDQPKVPTKGSVTRIFPTADGAYKLQARDATADAALEKTAAQTEDGFVNFAAKLGVGAPGAAPRNLISRGGYEFNAITRNRLQLEYAYRGSWIAGKVIDCPAEDSTREGVSITTNERADQVADIKGAMTRLSIMGSYRDCKKWGSLYGGAIGVYQLEGQKLASPLKLSSIEKGQFKGISVYDRWQLWPVLTKLIESGPHAGLPMFYDLVQGQNIADPQSLPGYASENSERSPQGTIRIHHSRLFRMGGIKLPFFQAITEMLWDESVLERMWDKLISFDDATMNAMGLIHRANLRVIRFANLRQIMASGPDAKKGLQAQVEWMREMQSNEGVTAMDKEDEFESYSYSFAGLPDTLREGAQQVSGACNIPLVRLFCQTPGGLNATGDADLRMYYDTIKMGQEATMRNPLDTTLKILWRSETGEDAPKDMQFTFNPLWQQTAEDRSNVGKNVTETILAAHEQGVTSAAMTLRELKQASPETGLFTHITDEDIAQAEDEPPPSPDELAPEPGIEPGDGGEGPAKPKAKDSAWSRFARAITGRKKSAVRLTETKDEDMKSKDSLAGEILAKAFLFKAALHVAKKNEGKKGSKDASTKDGPMVALAALSAALGAGASAMELHSYLRDTGLKGINALKNMGEQEAMKLLNKVGVKDAKPTKDFSPVSIVYGLGTLAEAFSAASNGTRLFHEIHKEYNYNKYGHDEKVSDHQKIKDWLAKK